MNPRAAIALLALACDGRSPSTDVARAESSRPAIQLPQHPDTLALTLGVPAESLLVAGQERYTRQAFDSAQAIWKVEANRAQIARDSAAEARVRMWLGLAAWRLGDYPSARREGEHSLRLKRRLGLDRELSRSFNALGLLAWNEGRHSDALVQFDSAIAAARRHDDDAGVARAIANIPLIKTELGDFDGARRGLEEAFQTGTKLGDERTQANALTNLARLEIRLGNYTAALALIEQARSRYDAIDYATGEANAFAQAATAWLELGDLQRAMAAADSMLSIARIQGLRQEIAAAHEIFADIHARSGHFPLALKRLAEAETIDSALGLAVERGINRRRAAAILLELGESSAAVASARAALAAHRDVEANAEVVFDLVQLAVSLAAMGDSTAARATADTARRVAETADDPIAMREAAVVQARLAIARGDPTAALRMLRVVPAQQLAPDGHMADVRSQALFALGRLDDARVEGERAIAELERQRGSLGQGPLRSTYLRQRTSPYARLVAIHLARGDTAAAFEVAASLPGRNLAERLSGVTEGTGAVAGLAKSERLLVRIGALESELTQDQKSLSPERRQTLREQLEATQLAYEEELARQAKSSEAALLGYRHLRLHDVQTRLGPNDALLLTLSGPQQLDIFVVRSNATYVDRSLVTERALSNRVRLVRQLVASARRADAAASLGELRDLVLPRSLATALNGVQRLLIVPHGALGSLPFAALLDKRSGSFLAEQYVVSYLPSVAALMFDDAGPPRTGMAVFAPLADSLPGTRREAQAIARLVGGSRVHSAERSSEDAVRASLVKGEAIHIASHGSHNALNPLFSRMTVGKRARTDHDERLHVHEILALRTRSPLVFLSGCETGLASAGEAPFDLVTDESSLAHALLVAGARNVVATLWRVGDSAAVAIAESFYRHLQSGHPPDEALALAQREAIKRYTDMTWAAYATFGAVQARKFGVASRITEQRTPARDGR